MPEGLSPVGRLVRGAREAFGMGLRECARRAGISAPHLSRIETDAAHVAGPAALDAIARVLGLDRDALYAAARRVPPELEAWIVSSPQAIAAVRALSVRLLTTPLSDP